MSDIASEHAARRVREGLATEAAARGGARAGLVEFALGEVLSAKVPVNVHGAQPSLEVRGRDGHSVRVKSAGVAEGHIDIFCLPSNLKRFSAFYDEHRLEGNARLAFCLMVVERHARARDDDCMHGSLLSTHTELIIDITAS